MATRERSDGQVVETSQEVSYGFVVTDVAVELSGLRAKLHTPGPLYHAQMLIPQPAIASILASCGFDFLMLDVEHGPFTRSTLRACVDACAATTTATVARIASSSETEIGRLLDLGLDGVVVPKIESAAQAESVVRAARYAPEGTRRIGSGSALRTQSDLVRENGRVAVIAMIESRLGAENVDEIVANPGLDGILMGRTT